MPCAGVTLAGARWDAEGGCLAEAAPTAIYSPMPLLWLVPVREERHASSVVALDVPPLAPPVPLAALKSGDSGGLQCMGLHGGAWGCMGW